MIDRDIKFVKTSYNRQNSAIQSKSNRIINYKRYSALYNSVDSVKELNNSNSK